MIGMCKQNGTSLSGEAHLKQSIQDILSTPKGSRLFLREYGCDLHPFISQPINKQNWVDVAAEIQSALLKWEPRFIFESASLDQELSDIENGKIVIVLKGKEKVGHKALEFSFDL